MSDSPLTLTQRGTLAKFARLRRVRLGQTGARAAATQRKIEALYGELRRSGLTNADIERRTAS